MFSVGVREDRFVFSLVDKKDEDVGLLEDLLECFFVDIMESREKGLENHDPCSAVSKAWGR